MEKGRYLSLQQHSILPQRGVFSLKKRKNILTGPLLKWPRGFVSARIPSLHYQLRLLRLVRSPEGDQGILIAHANEKPHALTDTRLSGRTPKIRNQLSAAV